jgi:hypothetical protein
MATAELLRVVSYGSADFGCPFAPPNICKRRPTGKIAIWMLCIIILVAGYHCPVGIHRGEAESLLTDKVGAINTPVACVAISPVIFIIRY